MSIQKIINFLSKNPVVARFGNYMLLTYGLIIAITMFLGYFLGSISLQVFQIDSKILFWWIIISIPCLIFFSRAVPLLLRLKTFAKNPKELINSTWFTFLGGFLGFWFSCFFLVLNFKVSVLRFSDALLMFLPFFHAIGRIACINYGCCSSVIKKESSGIYFLYKNSVARATRFFSMKGKKIYPVHVYEILWNFIIGILLVSMLFFVRYSGIISAVYFFSYGFLRIILEPKRGEDKKIFLGYSLYQILLTSIFWIYGFSYLVAAIISKVLIVFNFKIQYLLNSLSLIPLMAIMCFIAFIIFGLNKIEKEGCKYHSQCAKNPLLRKCLDCNA